MHAADDPPETPCEGREEPEHNGGACTGTFSYILIRHPNIIMIDDWRAARLTACGFRASTRQNDNTSMRPGKALLPCPRDLRLPRPILEKYGDRQEKDN